MSPLARHEIPDALRAAKERAVELFLTIARRVPPELRELVAHPRHNVVGVGVGSKIVAHNATGQPSVRLYVARKLDRRLVRLEHLLPSEIFGIPTDVVEVGRLRAQIPSSRRRLRPVRPGCSIGFGLAPPHEEQLMAGTLGAVVVRDGTRFILSNNHVLAHENALPLGSPIYQPALLDLGDPRDDAIARLSQFVPLTAEGENRVDCAIAEILSPDLASTRMMARVGKLAGPEPIDAVEGMPVEKVGRGTGHTAGTIFDVSASINLQYETGELTFADQLFIRGTSGPFSDYGDSGALVVDATSRRGVGLLVGGDGDRSIANHLTDVLTELGVTLSV